MQGVPKSQHSGCSSFCRSGSSNAGPARGGSPPVGSRGPTLPLPVSLHRPLGWGRGSTRIGVGPSPGTGCLLLLCTAGGSTTAAGASRAPTMHRRCNYDMKNVRCSARLAKRPMLLLCNRHRPTANLCRTLGLSAEEHAPIEKILQEYVVMYRGSLPEQVVVLISTFFGIDDDYIHQLDDALVELAGEGVDELLDGGVRFGIRMRELSAWEVVHSESDG